MPESVLTNVLAHPRTANKVYARASEHHRQGPSPLGHILSPRTRSRVALLGYRAERTMPYFQGPLGSSARWKWTPSIRPHRRQMERCHVRDHLTPALETQDRAKRVSLAEGPGDVADLSSILELDVFSGPSAAVSAQHRPGCRWPTDTNRHPDDPSKPEDRVFPMPAL